MPESRSRSPDNVIKALMLGSAWLYSTVWFFPNEKIACSPGSSINEGRPRLGHGPAPVQGREKDRVVTALPQPDGRTAGKVPNEMGPLNTEGQEKPKTGSEL